MTDQTTGDDGVRIRALEGADTPALVDLFERCYGRSYGNPLFYDPAALAATVAAGTLRSVVAAGADDRLLGHTGISIRHPGARVCETGNTVVDPAARGRGLLRRLGAGLRERVVGDGFCGYVHYPTTAHHIMQRASVTGGGREVGLMLGYVAETTEYREVATRPGRLAATVAYQPFRPLPARGVFLPGRYRALLEDIYADAGIVRDVTAGDRALAAGSADVRPTWQHRRGLLHVFVARAAADLAARVGAAMREHPGAVTHVDLALDTPDVHPAVEVLAELGFVFCALLPDFARTDVLRLQALRDPLPEVYHPDLSNDRARWLCARIRAEAGVA